MHTINIKRLELLAKIMSNRKIHADEFKEAYTGYREQAIDAYNTILKEIKEGGKIRRGINLPEPQDHTKDYDRIITMLEMSSDKIIELDSSSFDQYVMDNWSWKESSSLTNSMYSNRYLSGYLNCWADDKTQK